MEQIDYWHTIPPLGVCANWKTTTGGALQIDWQSLKLMGRKLSDTLDAQPILETVLEPTERFGPPTIRNSNQGGQLTNKDQVLFKQIGNSSEHEREKPLIWQQYDRALISKSQNRVDLQSMNLVRSRRFCQQSIYVQ